jgi:hypothetical protein
MFKLNQAERDELKRRAKLAGLSRSDYVRCRAFGIPIKKAIAGSRMG